MSTSFFSVLRFHLLRLVRTEPIAAAAFALCFALAIIAAVSLVTQAQRASKAQRVLADLRAAALLSQSDKPRAAEVSLAPLDLPPFRSTDLVSVLNQTAIDSSLVLDEVTYALEDNVNQPYLRYRITMTLNATYPLIRRLAEQLDAKVPHLTLDSINCARKDVAVAELSCDIVMSGFFMKGAHG